ncbi:MAG: hypothetical protein EZS28_021294, partial [Streblomastix strix]
MAQWVWFPHCPVECL